MPAGNLAICFGYVDSRCCPLYIYNIRFFFLSFFLISKTNVIIFSLFFSPTLMGSSAGNDMLEQKLQARVIETILLNTYQIFDDD